MVNGQGCSEVTARPAANGTEGSSPALCCAPLPPRFPHLPRHTLMLSAFLQVLYTLSLLLGPEAIATQAPFPLVAGIIISIFSNLGKLHGAAWTHSWALRLGHRECKEMLYLCGDFPMRLSSSSAGDSASPSEGDRDGQPSALPHLFLHLLPRHYTLSKTWHAQSMSFRASSNFLSQKMVSFIASNNNVLMAFRSMSKKNLISPEMLMRCRALPAQRGGLWYPAAHQGWEAGGKATGNSNVLAEYLQLGTAVGFLLFILFGLLISEDGRKWWDHDTFTASIGDSGMVSH